MQAFSRRQFVQSMILATAGVATFVAAGCSGGSGGSGGANVATNENYKKLNSLNWEIAEEWSDDSYYYVVFMVENIGDDTIERFEANFEFLDKDGKTINNDGTRYNDCPLPAGKKACMWAMSDASAEPSDVAKAVVANYSYWVGDQKFTVNALKETLQQRTDDLWSGYKELDFDECNVLALDYGVLSASGEQVVTVRNEGADEIGNIEIALAYYDSEGVNLTNDRLWSDDELDHGDKADFSMRPIQVSETMRASIASSDVFLYSYSILDTKDDINHFTINLASGKAYGNHYTRK